MKSINDAFNEAFNTRSLFETAFDNLAKVSYPPYNIRKTPSGYVLEVAAAGYTMAELDIQLEDNQLKISCTPAKRAMDQFIHQGLTYRPWVRVFTMADTVSIANAEFVNGLLQVYFTSKVPEAKKPLKINIGQPKAESHPQLLNEDSAI